MITRMPRRCACFRNSLKIAQGTVGRMNILVVGDVVAVVAPRRGKEREQPDGGDAQVLQIIQLRAEPAEIAHAVVVAVVKGARVDFVDDGVLVPLWIGIQRSRGVVGHFC